MQFLIATNGLAYLQTPAGVVVQVTPNSFKVKDLDGQVLDMNVTQVVPELRALSAALAKEAQYWISALRPQLI